MPSQPPSPESSVAQGDLDAYTHVPARILEQGSIRMFPHATTQDLRELSNHGWARLGVATAIVNERGEVLMLEHAESPKLTEGSIGPLMETTRLRPGQVESTEQTMYRAIQEELGIDNPKPLGLTARLIGAWTLHKWPVGDRHTHEHVLGVNPIVVIHDEAARKIGRFINTEEIRRAQFMSVEAIIASTKLRPGLLGWLGGLTSRGLLDKHHGIYHPVNFEDVDVLDEPGWTDAVFSNVDL